MDAVRAWLREQLSVLEAQRGPAPLTAVQIKERDLEEEYPSPEPVRPGSLRHLAILSEKESAAPSGVVREPVVESATGVEPADGVLMSPAPAPDGAADDAQCLGLLASYGRALMLQKQREAAGLLEMAAGPVSACCALLLLPGCTPDHTPSLGWGAWLLLALILAVMLGAMWLMIRFALFLDRRGAEREREAEEAAHFDHRKVPTNGRWR